MKKEEFEELLNHGECTWLDWKRDFPIGLLKGKKAAEWEEGKGELLKDLVSIANRDDGRLGFLVYGVKDHGSQRKVTGISKSWDDADFQTWATNLFEPPPRFSYSELAWAETKTAGIFEIGLSPQYPHVAVKAIGEIISEGQVWFRRGSKNTIAHYEDLRRMFSGHEPFKVARLTDPVMDQIRAYYGGKGLDVALPRMSEKDSRLARGYLLAFYPNTRREVWVGEHRGQYEHILMIKPRIE